jgi:hypothetical protein
VQCKRVFVNESQERKVSRKSRSRIQNQSIARFREQPPYVGFENSGGGVPCTKGAALASSLGAWSFSSDVVTLAMGFSSGRKVLGFFSNFYGVLDSPAPRGTNLACKLTRENSLPHFGHAKNEIRARHCRRRANHPNQAKHQPRAGPIAILK